MSEQIGPNRVGMRRVSRSTSAKSKRSSRSGGKSVRVEGLKAVDTIPRLEHQEFEDGESKGLERLLGEDPEEGFTNGNFVDDLARALVFLESLPFDSQTGRRLDLHEECARILQDEVSKAREMAALRKAVPRA
ncbi:MAG: hypothetical protein JWP91_2152 [Fibrobacteres bacterium]|nr:hypothetical protein [Fibrobacterota bacterium]